MHSRIIQASKEPIEKEDYITEDNYIYEHWFLNSVADYVSNDCNRDEDIKWLKDCTPGFTFDRDKNGEYFIINSKEEYFKPAFEGFKRALEELHNIPLEKFIRYVDIYGLNSYYDDKHGFYIDIDDELLTLDEFVRYCDNGNKYYIGGTVDYHC